MFVIRQATLDDLPTLLKLAKMVHFINLPADKDLLAEKIQASRLSFTGAKRMRATVSGCSSSRTPRAAR